MSEEPAGVAKGLLSSALLVAAVGAILLAGLVLRTSGRTEALPQPVATAPEPDIPLGSEVAPETDAPPDVAEAPPIAPVPPPVLRETAKELDLDPVLMRLATRAEADAGRLSRAKGPWTAQLMVACKPDTVERVLAAGGSATKLFLLPARVKDEACFRVCFGDYATSKDALAAADLPPALRGKDKIGAAEIVKVLP